MAIAKLEYVFGADLDPLKLSLNEVNKLITQTGKDAAKAGADGIGKFNVELIRLKDYADKLKNIGLPDSIPDTAKRSRIALTDLSRVVQDLPFGFIGIQNNIPALVQSFGNLTKEGGGLAGGLKLLGQSFLGPSGVFFAFSAVTSLITVAIQQYGSLGAAIEGIFGKVSNLSKVTRDAAKSQEELNKSSKTSGQIIAEATGGVDAQITKIKLLTEVISNLNNSEDLRKNALSELQKISKAYYGQITTSIGDVNKLTAATDKYTQSLLANAIAEGYKSQLTDAAVNLEKQKNVLKELNKSSDELNKKSGRNIVIFTGGQVLKDTKLESATLTGQIEEQNKVITTAKLTLDNLKESFKNATLESLKFVEPTVKSAKAVKDFKYEIDELIGALSVKTEISDIKELADVILDVNKKSSERVGALNKLKQYGDGAFNALSIEKSGFDNLKDAIDTYIHGLQVIDLYQKGRAAASDLQVRADKNAANAIDDLTKSEEDLFKIIEKNNDYNATVATTPFDIKGMLTGTKDLEKTYISVGKSLLNYVITPLNDLFDVVLSKGKKSWEDFTATVVESLKKLLVKLAAAAALAAILSAVSGGTAAGGVGFGKAFAGIFGLNLGGKGKGVANPSFGGVQPAGMAMNGNVNLVLRGQDLVGSLNRTNSQLSRIG